MVKGGGAGRRRSRLLPTLLLIAAIFAVPTAVYAWGRTSSTFTVESIEVSGTDLVSPRQVLRLLRRDFRGHNLFTVTARDVRRTLSPLCYVADVSVDRAFPDVLRVRLVEHRPAMYALAGSRWFVLDADGRVICEVSPARDGAAAKAASAAAVDATSTAAPAVADYAAATESDATRLLQTLQDGPPGAAVQLPCIAASGRLRRGSSVEGHGVRDALAVSAGLPAALRERLRVVEASGEGQLKFRLEGGLLVVWGDAARSQAKTLALRAVLDRYTAARQSCTFADVSIPDRVLARPVLK